MAPRPLPEELRVFIRDAIPTMEHADVLVYLMRIAPVAVTVGQVATMVPLPTDGLERCLADLAQTGLCAAETGTDGTSYRYAPRSSYEAHRCELLLAAYAARPVALVREVFERPAI